MRIIVQAVLVTFLSVCGFGADGIDSSSAAKLALEAHAQARANKAAGRVREAEAYYAKALALWDQAGEQYLLSKCITLMNAGELHRELQRMKEADVELTEAGDIARRFQPAHPQQYPEVLSRLGALYSQTGREERGRTLLNEAIALFGPFRDTERAELAYAYNSLGLIEIAEGHFSAGEANLREAVRLSELSEAGDRRETLAYQTNVALALIKEGQFERAETLLVHVRSGVEALTNVPQQLLGTVFAELGAIAFSTNKFSIAEEYGQQELAAMMRQMPVNRLAVALAKVSLANVYIRQGRAHEAAGILPEAVAEERRLDSPPGVLANAVRRLAELRALEKSWNESSALYREALALYEKAPGPEHRNLGAISREYAAVRKRTGAKTL